MLAVGLVFEPPKKRDAVNDEKDHDHAKNARVKALVALASRAGEALGELVESGAAVDDHLLDQLIVFMALADGRGGKKIARRRAGARLETRRNRHRRLPPGGRRALRGFGGAAGVKEGLVAVECVGIGANVR